MARPAMLVLAVCLLGERCNDITAAPRRVAGRGAAAPAGARRRARCCRRRGAAAARAPPARAARAAPPSAAPAPFPLRRRAGLAVGAAAQEAAKVPKIPGME
jgi:hypothetical protein